MTSKVTIQATRITQPKAGKQITNSSGKTIKSPDICRDGNANPAYHPWEYKTLNNFIKGKQIQCGRKSTYSCNLKTVKWIKGYRNTCPLAGCCGTFNRPAPLILDKFNFTKKNIKKAINIHKVTVKFQHKVTGVDVGKGTGSETTRWAGYFPYVDITLYNGNTKIQTIRHNTEVPLAKNGTVLVTFDKKIKNYNPNTDNLRIEINYSANGAGKYYTKATNPSIIYATGFTCTTQYTYVNTPKITLEKSISATADKNTIITDPRNPNNRAGIQNCRNTITHTIRYLNTTVSDIAVSLPEHVTYTQSINTSTKEITYTYQDTSGIEGLKTIEYYLKSNKNKKITKTYIATLYQKPTINIQTNYIKNKPYNNGDIISVQGNCWNKIDIYVDGNKKLLISFNETVDNAALIAKINELSCGRHVLQVYIDDTYYDDFNIKILPPTFYFSSDLLPKYTQSDNNATISITRTDSAIPTGIDVSIVDTGNTQSAIQTINMEPGSSITHQIDLSTPGQYTIQCQYNDGCSDKTYDIGVYTIIPEHKQSYDALLIRGENSVEFDSIVIREGDKYTKPVTYTEATLINSMNDFVLFGKDGVCNIGDLGYAIIGIKNTTQASMYNVCVELNPLYLSEDDNDEFNPLVMEWKTGMLQAFNDNFNILNQNIKDIVEVFNIQNQSLINEGTENVVLCFKEIQAGKHIEVKIPYSSSYPREIFMNFLVLNEEHDFIDIESVLTNNPYDDYTETNFISKINSKMAVRKSKSISLSAQDAYSTELSIQGDDLDRNDLSNISDLDITYHANVLDCDGKMRINTKIINDPALIPTGYQIGNGDKQKFDIYDENGDIKTNIDEEYGNQQISDFYIKALRKSQIISKPLSGADIFLRYLDKNNNIKHIKATTNNQGYATFNFIIPEYFQTTQDKNTSLGQNIKYNYYLEDILDNVDILYLGDSYHKKESYHSEIINKLPSAKISIYGFYYITDSDDKYFISGANVQNKNINNITKLYIIGRLTDSNGNGLNDEIISYQNKTNKIYKEYVTGDVLSDVLNTSILVDKDTDGLFSILISQNNISTYNLFNVLKNSALRYEGDLFNGEITTLESALLITDDDKLNTSISVTNDYGLYRRGETIKIRVQLFSDEEVFTNTIDLSQNTSCSQNVHIFYKACSTKNKEGWKTIYKTNDIKLLPTQIEEYIYCNVDTSLEVYAILEKSVVENHNVNMLSLKAINGYKPNKNVIVKGIIAPNKEKKRLGDYLALTAIDVDIDGYSYDRSSDVLFWNIGEMSSFEEQNCHIILEAEHVGHNTIYVCGFDYLTEDKDITYQTELSISCDNRFLEEAYIKEAIPIKAHLSANSNDNSFDAFGRVFFEGYDEDTETWKTISTAEIQLIDNEYYAQGYIRLEKPTSIRARYEGSDIFTAHYQPAISETLNFNNVSKYNLNICFFDDAAQTDDSKYPLCTNQESEEVFYVREEIRIPISMWYNQEQNEQGQCVYTKKYRDKKINLKVFVEEQELHNIQYENGNYIVKFSVTHAGEYTIRAYIPETDEIFDSVNMKTIQVKYGENDD